MSMFKKGDKVVKVLNVMGIETATLATVASVKKGVVLCEGSGMSYNDKTGMEINAGYTSYFSKLIVLEGE